MFAAENMDVAKQCIADQFPGYFDNEYRCGAEWKGIHIGGLHKYNGATITIDEVRITIYQYELEQIQYHGVMRLVRTLFEKLDKPAVQF